MSQGKPRDPRKEQQWRRWIPQWQHSGLSVRAFCARHHLAAAEFLRLASRDPATPSDTPRLVPVQFVPDDAAVRPAYLEVVLAGGRTLRVAPGFDAATLRQLLAVLEEVGPC